jgi:hypothetical protein
MKTLTLTHEEAYILGCIMGHVRYSESTSSLLMAVDSLFENELGSDDFDKVGFTVSTKGNNVQDTTIDFYEEKK